MFEIPVITGLVNLAPLWAVMAALSPFVFRDDRDTERLFFLCGVVVASLSLSLAPVRLMVFHAFPPGGQRDPLVMHQLNQLLTLSAAVWAGCILLVLAAIVFKTWKKRLSRVEVAVTSVAVICAQALFFFAARI
ncbi:MAG: hypothetical protein ING75_05605 [Rhodocyclaceae bacterium]|nr:hypothetical protein [Rhodocyclaceae bacterium]